MSELLQFGIEGVLGVSGGFILAALYHKVTEDD